MVVATLIEDMGDLNLYGTCNRTYVSWVLTEITVYDEAAFHSDW